MLNIDEMEKEFNKILSSLTNTDLQEWLSDYEHQELSEKLRKGESVSINYIVPQAININIQSMNISLPLSVRGDIDNNNYEKAA